MKVYRILFFWYYRLVPDHFKQYPPIKSIKLLVEHVDSYESMWRGECKVLQTALKEIEQLRKELSNIRMQQIANPGTIEHLNDMFGTDFNKPTDN